MNLVKFIGSNLLLINEYFGNYNFKDKVYIINLSNKNKLSYKTINYKLSNTLLPVINYYAAK